MVRLNAIWLTPFAIMVLSLGLSAKRAMAQTTYTFNASYDSLAYTKNIAPNVSATTLSGQSTDVLYNLTTINGLTYSQVDVATNSFRFNTDPTVFGLQGIPKGEIVFSGNSTNKLFGSDNATGVIDFTTLMAKSNGTFNITGGEGIFAGATGTLAFSEVDTLSLDPTIPTRARATVNGSFQVVPQRVPEPTNITALICLGLIGVSLLVYRRSNFKLAILGDRELSNKVCTGRE